MDAEVPAAAGGWGPSRRTRPDPMRNVPLLGVLLDKSLDATQELLGRAYLVGAGVARRLRVDQRRALGHVRIVGQPVNTNWKERGAQTQRERRGPERGGARVAEKRHHMARPGDVAVDG